VIEKVLSILPPQLKAQEISLHASMDLDVTSLEKLIGILIVA